jgi:autotransporter-associated beta strand protein
VTFAGVISGSGSVAQIGTGTTILTAANTYSGGTLLAAGALIAGDDNALGPGALTVAANSTGPTTLDNSLGATSLANAIVLNPSANLTVAGSNPLTLAGPISGAGALTKDGASTLILTSDDSYSGGTTISAGILQLGNGGTTGSIVGDVTDNAALAFDRSDTVTFAGVISGNGTVAQIGSGTTVLTSDNSYSGGTTISAGTLQVGNGGGAGSVGSGPVLDDGALVFNRSGTVTVPGSITGTGSLTQEGVAGGTLVLTGANTYSGGTAITSGLCNWAPTARRAASSAM